MFAGLVELWAPSTIRTQDGLDKAVRSLHSILNGTRKGSSSFVQLMETIIRAPHSTMLKDILVSEPKLVTALHDHFSNIALSTQSRDDIISSVITRTLDKLNELFKNLPGELATHRVAILREKAGHVKHCIEVATVVAFERTGPTKRRRANSKKSRDFNMTPNEAAFRAIGEDLPCSANVVGILPRLLAMQQDLVLVLVFCCILFCLTENDCLQGFIKLFHSSDIVNHVNRQDSNNSPALNLDSKEASTSHGVIRALRSSEFYKYDSEMGDWRIIFSTRGFRSLRSFESKSPAIYDILKVKLRELSHGYFSRANHKLLVGHDLCVPVYEAKLISDLRLIYSVDCGPIQKHQDMSLHTASTYEETQYIRVYDICTHAQMDNRLWSTVSIHLAGKGGNYRERCLFRETPIEHSRGKYVTPPASFPDTVDQERDDIEPPTSVASDDLLNLHTIFMLEKYIPYSHALLDAVRVNGLSTHMFQVSPAEDMVIYYPSSCFVIGRSGTGKTTTVLYKMIGLEQAALRSDRRFRQVFVTRSPILAGHVEKSYFELWESIMAQQGIEWRMPNRPFRLSGDSLLDYDSEEPSKRLLPDNLGELKDDDFPLFISYDELCGMLWSKKQGPMRKPLTYSQFRSTIWEHFDFRLKAALDPSLVYSEFMGVIKGHEMTIESETGYLDRAAYLALRSQRTHYADEMSRSRIYDMFEIYLQKKRSLYFYDSPEITHRILKSAEERLTDNKFDFLYVDEAQDNLIIDACLLRTLCRSPHGLFWSGDTAQTIAHGSSFRFKDLKSLFYRLEMDDPVVKLGCRAPVHPHIFQLLENYRTHKGILRAASFIVRLLIQLFPQSIDGLGPEMSQTNGPKPKFFIPDSEEEAGGYKPFLANGESSAVEFGHDQAIIVRNKAAQRRLRAKIGDKRGLIITLYQSKGLEFNDVLLYDFFADSDASVEAWKVALSGIQETTDIRQQYRCDELRCGPVQTELKCLYVAITRARKNVWIWDTSEKSEPMKELWMLEDLITMQPVSEINILSLGSSTPDQWLQRGRDFFGRQLYSHAATCFDNAGDHYQESIARAYHARQKAQSLIIVDESYKNAYRSCAELFVLCCTQSEAQNTSEHGELLRKAAECFALATNHQKAGSVYEGIGRYSEAAKQWELCGDFEKLMVLLLNQRHRITPDVFQKAKISVLKWFVRQDRYRECRNLCGGDEGLLESLQKNGYRTLYLEHLVLLGRLLEAAREYLMDKEEETAISLLLRDSSPTAKEVLTDVVAQNLRKRFSFRASPAKSNSDVKRYLDLAEGRGLKHEEVGVDANDEEILLIYYNLALPILQISFCRIVWNMDYARLRETRHRHVKGDLETLAHAIIAFDITLKHDMPVKPLDSERQLRLLLDYHREYRRQLLEVRHLSGRQGASMRLFGHYKDSNSPDQYVVPQYSFIHRWALEQEKKIRNDVQGTVLIKVEFLDRAIEHALEEVLNEQGTTLHRLAAPFMERVTHGSPTAMIKIYYQPMFMMVPNDLQSLWSQGITTNLHLISHWDDDKSFSFSPETAWAALKSIETPVSVNVAMYIHHLEGYVAYLALLNYWNDAQRHNPTKSSSTLDLTLPEKWFKLVLSHLPIQRKNELDWRAYALEEARKLLDLCVGIIPFLSSDPEDKITPTLLYRQEDVRKDNLVRYAYINRISYALVLLMYLLNDKKLQDSFVNRIRTSSNTVPHDLRFGRAMNWDAAVGSLLQASKVIHEKPLRVFYFSTQDPLVRKKELEGLKAVYCRDPAHLLWVMRKIFGASESGNCADEQKGGI
ncbi:hypothetical protein FRC02_000403 [Tulasnella sp. 418]|nr:hypothetical protein FRC02_000403 [Tulasnella sp. 418]